MSRKLEVILILVGMAAHIVLYLSDFSYNMIDANYPEQSNELGRGINVILIVVSVTIINVIVGAVSLLLFRKNKRPKAASAILLIFAMITTILTYGSSFLANIFYLIAGVMGVVRGSKTHKTPL
ncbi:hypothetical protein [Pseudogracilibacillus sp. SO30301A]|uniref:hypothetical protein n=1 Tax=Pseudogracilibacillus sp. SO30301A TaxID=3098291 RepID=UPI00300DFF5B